MVMAGARPLMLPPWTWRGLSALRQQLARHDRRRIEITRVARLRPRAITTAGVEIGLGQSQVDAIAPGIEERRTLERRRPRALGDRCHRRHLEGAATGREEAESEHDDGSPLPNASRHRLARRRL